MSKRKLKSLKNSTFPKIQSLALSKMSTRSQKRKAVAELVSRDFEASLAENNSTENLIASSSKNPRLELENLEEIKTTLRKEIMSDLTKILAENQKEMFKLIAPLNKKQTVHSNVQDSDSEPENVSVARTSTPVKTYTATNPKTTPVNSRNKRLRCIGIYTLAFPGKTSCPARLTETMPLENSGTENNFGGDLMLPAPTWLTS